MLVSTIIANGRLLADVPNTNFYTDAEALFAVQTSWENLYAMMCDTSSDFFTEQQYLTNAQFVPDQNRSNTYSLSIPNLYRLRLLQYQGYGGTNQYWPASKMNIENFGNSQQSPGYRMVGSNQGLAGSDTFAFNATISTNTTTYIVPNNTGAQILSNFTVTVSDGIIWSITLAAGTQSTIMIYDLSGYTNWCLWYYPPPAQLYSAYDLSYPLSMIPEIMSYQVAIEIRRKQNIDFTTKQQRRDELLASMAKQMNNDDAKAETVKNTFSQGFAPYI